MVDLPEPLGDDSERFAAGDGEGDIVDAQNSSALRPAHRAVFVPPAGDESGDQIAQRRVLLAAGEFFIHAVEDDDRFGHLNNFREFELGTVEDFPAKIEHRAAMIAATSRPILLGSDRR